MIDFKNDYRVYCEYCGTRNYSKENRNTIAPCTGCGRNAIMFIDRDILISKLGIKMERYKKTLDRVKEG